MWRRRSASSSSWSWPAGGRRGGHARDLGAPTTRSAAAGSRCATADRPAREPAQSRGGGPSATTRSASSSTRATRCAAARAAAARRRGRAAGAARAARVDPGLEAEVRQLVLARNARAPAGQAAAGRRGRGRARDRGWARRLAPFDPVAHERRFVRRHARARRFDLEDILNRPGTYFNPETEVLLVVDDAPELDADLFEDAERRRRLGPPRRRRPARRARCATR